VSVQKIILGRETPTLSTNMYQKENELTRSLYEVLRHLYLTYSKTDHNYGNS